MSTLAAVNTTTEFFDVTTGYASIPFLTRMISFVGILGTGLAQAFLCGQYKRCGECGAWRGLKKRATFLCPSICLIPTIYVCIAGLMGASKAVAPDYTKGSDAREFIDGIWGTALSSIAFHTIMAILRIWFTVSRWQSLIVCEIFKTAFVIHVCIGVTKVEVSKFETSGHISFYAFIAITVVPLLVPSFARLYYLVKTGFSIEKFEPLYLGHEPDCPIKRCLCLNVKWCGGSGVAAGKVQPEKQLETEKDPSKEYVRKEAFTTRQVVASNS